MSRKTYTAIAKALADNGASTATIAAVADALAPTNPLFDRGRFITAATPKESA